MVTAKTFQVTCVAAVSGGAGVAGAYVVGGLGAASAAGIGVPELAPVVAGAGDMVGVWTFGYLGGIIGNVVCR